ncbi:GIY-YIG nuclease family protein [Membranicola marinus]|uniref:GIY-YIG nuclease family protein n=1 Tax=Membranihabitans marinus TaxID=1227546 RepID=A0A953HTI3_9BACT|nr:GIY-YIG nuclease family protein [Membranihabitans marinus]MBY5957603.1 GIY-YIG nuclease family protein [Membranihabitans marinus]
MSDRFYVYIIYSSYHNIYYKGFSTNIGKRLLQHNNDESRYTAKKGPWKLVFVQSFDNQTQALKRERSLKKYDHNQIAALIKSRLNELG